MRTPKILFDASPMMDTTKSGVGYYVDYLFTSLGEHYGDKLQLTGYYFDLLGHGHKISPVVNGLRFHKIWLVPGKLLSLTRRLGFQPFLELFIQKSADIIVSTNYVSLPTIRKSKSALAIYDLSFLDHPEYLQQVNLTYLQRFCPASICRADMIITISEFTKQRLLHHFPDLKADIVITPIPPVASAISDTTLSDRLVALGIVERAYILFVSTLEPRKNILSLLKAYSLLPEATRKQYSLVLAGGKGWKNQDILAEIDRLQQQGYSIIMTGYVSDQEKHSLYSNAACFVMPSHYEGFGMPILEAMQYGLPVACSDIPVFHEAAGDGAVYFDKDNPSDIATSLSRVLSEPELREHLSTAAVKQLTHFSWKNNAKVIFDALDKLSA